MLANGDRAAGQDALGWRHAALGVLLLLGCQRIEPTLVVNRTDGDLAIRYYVPHREDPDGRRLGCALRESPPKWRRGVNPRVTLDGWQPVASARLDYENCTADLVIPPRATAWIFLNATCDDDEKILATNPQVRPVIQSFLAMQDGRRMDLQGWDVVRAFKRTHGTCALQIDAKDLR